MHEPHAPRGHPSRVAGYSPRLALRYPPAVFSITVQRPKRGNNTGVIYPTQKAKCPQNAHKGKLNTYFPLFMRACGESPRLRFCYVSGHRSHDVPTFFMLWGVDVSRHRSGAGVSKEPRETIFLPCSSDTPGDRPVAVTSVARDYWGSNFLCHPVATWATQICRKMS